MILLALTLAMQGALTPPEAPATDLEWVCAKHPDRVANLFSALDLTQPALASVQSAVAREDLPAACEALLAYYRNADTVSWFRRDLPEPGSNTRAEAEAILHDTFTFYELTDTVPRRADGGLAWSHAGPNEDREWAWALNRHFHLNTLLEAYFETGNIAYINRYDAHLRDWITASPYPGVKSSTAEWRGLEAHFRVRHWAEGFYALQEQPALTPAARILLLSSIPEHAHYLRHFHAGGNWATMEMSALATAGVCWPEFKDAKAWREYAKKAMLREMDAQVYPDGVQKELTSHYHYVALSNFQTFADLMGHAGEPVPAAFRQGLERMWNYLAYSMRPDGYGVLNNDSDRDYNRDRIVQRAKEYGRPDWAFIASNGARGEQPEGTPSAFFPWAGQLVMRSGWETYAQWAFFDAGPMGIGHWHRDRLHLSVMAHGRDILVDGGRYTYRGGAERNYFINSASHNVILVDGHGQDNHARATDFPMEDLYKTDAAFDAIRGAFTDGFLDVDDSVTHTRAVVYVRGKYWVVFDRISLSTPHTIQPLWHFHPECTVATSNGAVYSTDPEQGNVRIVPTGNVPWTVERVRGVEPPDMQGWWSRCYNEMEPATTAVYSAEIAEPTTFAWLILPAKGPVPEAGISLLGSDASRATVQVTAPEGTRDIRVILTGPIDATVE